MPSVADLIFVALLGVLAFTPLSGRLLGDAGIGWHIRTGQQILATHAIPRVDHFSSTMTGQPWFAWEWFYDVIVGELELRLGLNGVVWFAAVAIATAFAWLFSLLIRRGTNLVVALLLVLLAVSASMIHFLARPHAVSWLFTLTWFWILDSSENDGGVKAERRLWLLPPLMLVWVNLHGGFLVGFALLAIFWLGAMWNWLKARGGRFEELLETTGAAKRSQNLTWVGLLSLAATLANPYGWKLHEHVYSYLSNRFLMDHIEEFQSPNFHGVAQQCFLALLVIAIAVLVWRGRELRVSHGLTALFAVYSGLYASRNIPVSSVLLVLVAGPLVARQVQLPWAAGRGMTGSSNFLQRMAAVESGQRGHLWAVIAVVATLCIALNGGRLGSTTLMDAHFDSRRMPVEAVNYLEKNSVKGPVLSPDYWGGYLIYRLYPRVQVVVDDRHDLYGERFFRSYLRMLHVEPGWKDFLREHEGSCVVLPKDAALTAALVTDREWKVVYTDDVAVALVSARSIVEARIPAAVQNRSR